MNPDAYRLMTLGIGLDGISVPDASTFELRPRLMPVHANYSQLMPVAAA
jgi:hypothetical protein